MIKYKVEGGIATIAMTSYENRNALSPNMITHLNNALDKAMDDNDVIIIVLTGDKDVFSAGADLKHLESISTFSYAENKEDSDQLKNLFLKIYSLEKIVVAKVNGHAIAGGCGLMTVCDIVLIDENAKIGYTEVKIGFMAAMVMVFLQHLVGEKIAMELLLSGRLIKSEEAQRIGLVNNVYTHDEFDDKSNQYISKLLLNSPNSLKQTKRFYRSLNSENIITQLNRASEENAKLRLMDECKEGILAFLEKRSPNWINKDSK